MFSKKQLFVILALSMFIFSLAPAAKAKPSEYATIVRLLKTKYQAKKVGIPFMTLARVVVAVVHPAGVKSFKITLFNDLKFSRETLDKEMQESLRGSFGPEWTSIFRVRSRDGQQAYMYMLEDGRDVKITLVTIDKDDAAVIRATFDPDKLIEFMNDPKIFGIKLGDDQPAKKTGRQQINTTANRV